MENKTNIIAPVEYKQVETIAKQLLDGRDVIVDLSNTSLDEAKRICDFLNGVIYALNGNVKKVAKLVYLFTVTQ